MGIWWSLCTAALQFLAADCARRGLETQQWCPWRPIPRCTTFRCLQYARAHFVFRLQMQSRSTRSLSALLFPLAISAVLAWTGKMIIIGLQKASAMNFLRLITGSSVKFKNYFRSIIFERKVHKNPPPTSRNQPPKNLHC